MFDQITVRSSELATRSPFVEVMPCHTPWTGREEWETDGQVQAGRPCLFCRPKHMKQVGMKWCIYIYTECFFWRVSVHIYPGVFSFQYQPPQHYTIPLSHSCYLTSSPFRQLPSLVIYHGKYLRMECLDFSIAMLDYQGLTIECQPWNAAKPMPSLSRLGGPWGCSKQLKCGGGCVKIVYHRSLFLVICLEQFFLLKSMKVDSRFTWIERSKYMFGSWPFFMMKACDFVNSSNARHGNCIPWLSCLHDPTAPHTNKQRIKAVLVIHRASRLGRKGISDYALTRTERLKKSAT